MGTAKILVTEILALISFFRRVKDISMTNLRRRARSPAGVQP
jgi:hypothetical protein